MREIEFGVWDQMQTYEVMSSRRAADVYELHIRQGRLMEEVGFEYYWTLEHQGSYVGAVTSPQMFLTALARETERIRLGTMIWQLPFHHPVRLAQDIAMLDHLSAGRAEFGTGIGVHEHEFIRWGLNFYDRQAMGEESLDIIELAWRGDGRVSYEGRFWQIDEALIQPMPYQQPHPPIWAAVHSPAAIEFAARRGYDMAQNIDTDESMIKKFADWREAWTRYGHDGPMPRQFLMRVVHVAETDEKAHEQARAYLMEANTLGRELVAASKVGFGSNPRGNGRRGQRGHPRARAHLPRVRPLLRLLARQRSRARGLARHRDRQDRRGPREDRLRPLRRQVPPRAHAPPDGRVLHPPLRRGGHPRLPLGSQNPGEGAMPALEFGAWGAVKINDIMRLGSAAAAPPTSKAPGPEVSAGAARRQGRAVGAEGAALPTWFS